MVFTFRYSVHHPLTRQSLSNTAAARGTWKLWWVRKLVTGMRTEGWPVEGEGEGEGAIVGNELKNFASWWGECEK